MNKANRNQNLLLVSITQLVYRESSTASYVLNTNGAAAYNLTIRELLEGRKNNLAQKQSWAVSGCNLHNHIF